MGLFTLLRGVHCMKCVSVCVLPVEPQSFHNHGNSLFGLSSSFPPPTLPSLLFSPLLLSLPGIQSYPSLGQKEIQGVPVQTKGMGRLIRSCRINVLWFGDSFPVTSFVNRKCCFTIPVCLEEKQPVSKDQAWWLPWMEGLKPIYIDIYLSLMNKKNLNSVSVPCCDWRDACHSDSCILGV